MTKKSRKRIPAGEQWLYKNKEALKSARQGLKESAEGKVTKGPTYIRFGAVVEDTILAVIFTVLVTALIIISFILPYINKLKPEAQYRNQYGALMPVIHPKTRAELD